MMRKRLAHWTKTFKQLYWVGYLWVFVIPLTLLVWRYWDALNWQDETWVPFLAGIVGVSGGAAFIITMVAEGVGGLYMLLIPKVREGIREEGKAEGREEGKAEGRVEGKAEGRVEGKAEGRVEGKAEGRDEGAAEERRKWMAWLARREAAERAGLPFDEPPPG